MAIARWAKGKRERIQIDKIINEKWDITTWITRGYYEPLYTKSLSNLEETEKNLEWYNLPRLNQKEIKNLKRPITSKEIELMIKNFPTKKISGPDGLTGEFYNTF